MKGDMGNVQQTLTAVEKDLIKALDGVASAQNQFAVVRTNTSTLKTNIIGLGNYINNINSDLGSMLTSFDNYVKKMSSDMGFMKANLTEVNEDMGLIRGQSEEIRKKYDSLDYTTETLRTDMTEVLYSVPPAHPVYLSSPSHFCLQMCPISRVFYGI